MERRLSTALFSFRHQWRGFGVTDEPDESRLRDADVQSTVDTRQIPIQRVGVKAVRHPLTVCTESGDVQPTVGVWNLDVRLPADQKGTHMSRFVALLEENRAPLTVERFRAMLASMLEKLEAEAGRIEVTFPYFVNKTAPVSGVQSLLDYEVTLAGESRNGDTRLFLKVLVPVTSLCPCSKKISQYGAHNQRSHVTIDAEPRPTCRSRR